jgi:hypothetical protein
VEVEETERMMGEVPRDSPSPPPPNRYSCVCWQGRLAGIHLLAHLFIHSFLYLETLGTCRTCYWGWDVVYYQWHDEVQYREKTFKKRSVSVIIWMSERGPRMNAFESNIWNMEYGVRSPKFIWAQCHVMWTAVLIGCVPATTPPPHLGSYTRGAIGQLRLTTSPSNPLESRVPPLHAFITPSSPSL